MILHPPNLAEIDRTINYLYGSIGLIYKKFSIKVKKGIFKKMPPFKYFYIKDIESQLGSKVDFIVVMIPLLPEQIIAEDKEVIFQKILAAISIAERKGARLITLGAFTSIVTNQGLDLINRTNVAITSGNTYTAALCIKSIFKICDMVRIDMSKSVLCIVGATGDIGSICSKVLSKYVNHIVLCSRQISEESPVVSEIKSYSKCDVTITNNVVEAIRKSDIIISAASSTRFLFSIDDLRPGSILCDISIPPTVSRNITSDRPDVIAFEGGRAKFISYANIKEKRWKSFFPYNSIYGCLAESLILAFEDRFERFSLGRGAIPESKIDEIYNLGMKHGFLMADFGCSGKLLTENDFNRVKSLRVLN